MTPTSGNAPITLHLDASGCTDPDNNRLTFEWRVPTSLTTEDVVYTTAIADHEFTVAAAEALQSNPVIHLSVRDDGSPTPLETTRDWPIRDHHWEQSGDRRGHRPRPRGEQLRLLVDRGSSGGAGVGASRANVAAAKAVGPSRKRERAGLLQPWAVTGHGTSTSRVACQQCWAP
ncbi:MAG: hypothetical protein QM765_10745 [Myxococcales bacterium]